MAQFTRRTQLLLDEDRYRRLESEAESTGQPVSALIRRAIDEAYPAATEARRAAARDFLRAGEQRPAWVGESDEIEAEIDEAFAAPPDSEQA